MTTQTSAPPLPTSLEQFRATLRAHWPRLREKYRVRALWLFGSYVRGEQTPASDLDVLADFDQTTTLFEFVALENELSDLLGVKVDLVEKSGLKPALGRQVTKEMLAV